MKGKITVTADRFDGMEVSNSFRVYAKSEAADLYLAQQGLRASRIMRHVLDFTEQLHDAGCQTITIEFCDSLAAPVAPQVVTQPEQKKKAHAKFTLGQASMAQRDDTRLMTEHVQLWNRDGIMLTAQIDTAVARSMVRGGTHYVISGQAIGEFDHE